MLPHISAEDNIPPVGRKVYINPNFHNQLQGRSSNIALQVWERPAIHINPYFLQRQREYQIQQLQQQQQQLEQHMTHYEQTVAADLSPPPAKIISKASTCLVRKPPAKKVTAAMPTTLVKPTAVNQPPLVSISKRKLVRQGANLTKGITTTIASVPPAKRTKYKLIRAISLTSSSSTPLVKKRRTLDFVARYALRRTNGSASGKKLSSISHVLKTSVNKSLCMVSIHGVMYKKTAKNKLTKLDAASSPKVSIQQRINKPANSTGCTLFVRGTKFVLDPSGCRLTRVPAVNPKLNLIKNQRLRIDFGGLTYVSSPKAQNVFIRTTNHVSRAHLMSAKQRSMQLLNRSLVKTNVPCGIFQRLGKCAAFSRGKCRRLHDKRQVAICPRFLRGECTKSNCLLSHNVTLEKMPVCRYYLRGICVREDCPYLHKKLSRKAEICIDFLRGYCARAADCNMRHEFLCPEFARRGKCELTNCTYCKQMKSQIFSEIRAKPKLKTQPPVPQTLNIEPLPAEDIPSSSRYFICESDKMKNLPTVEQDDEVDDKMLDVDATANSSGVRQRPKLGTLPSFIPLGGSEG